MGEIRTYIIILRKPEGKRPFVRVRKRWYNNITARMNGLDLFGSEQDPWYWKF
jgi:hypothetical protein